MVKSISFILLVISLHNLLGCGWDDDREYEIHTRASFLVTQDPATGLRKVWRYEAGILIEGWNREMGVSDTGFSGLEYIDGELWMGDASGRQILRIEPSNDKVLKRFGDLPVRPHFFSVGERFILISDTITDQLAFIRIRNGELIITEFSGESGPAIHNNRLFFLQVGNVGLHVIDEWALTPRNENRFSFTIMEIQFNRLKNVYLTMKNDVGDDYSGLISGTDGSIAREGAPVNYQKIRYSPYLEARFGSEWLSDLRLSNNTLSSGAIIFPDSMTNFEVDFFESRLFYSWRNTLYYYDMNTQVRLDSFEFPDHLIESVYWVAGN